MIYDLSLIEWICIGLNKTNLNEAMDAIRSSKPIPETAIRKANERYIEKIFREEVKKQFSDSIRPTLEIVLNSIDAKPKDHDGDYIIKARAGVFGYQVKDNGIGMSLDDILQFLIIPFNTNKQGIEEIGRLGVGFLSSFKYCVDYPMRNRISLITKTPKEGYRLEFYATEDNVSSMRMRLSKVRLGKRGTIVRVHKGFDPCDRREVHEFLGNHLSGIPSFVARIKVGKKEVNNTGEKWYSYPVNLEAQGKEISQNVGFRLMTKDDKNCHQIL